MSIEYEYAQGGGGPRDMRSLRDDFDRAKKRGEVVTRYVSRDKEAHEIFMAKVAKRTAEIRALMSEGGSK
jgi:hypothetical protein